MTRDPTLMLRYRTDNKLMAKPLPVMYEQLDLGMQTLLQNYPLLFVKKRSRLRLKSGCRFWFMYLDRCINVNVCDGENG